MFACCCADDNASRAGGEVLISPLPATQEAVVTPVGITVLKQEKAVEMKAADPPAAADNHTTFTAVVDKATQDSPLGVQLDISDGKTLWVGGVRAGGSPLQDYNSKAPADKQVLVGDYVTAVNGKRGLPKTLLDELQACTRAVLTVQRPVTLEIRIHRNGAELGLNLVYAQKSRSLVVGAVQDGPVKTAKLDIREGDRIVAVDGKQGSAPELLEYLRQTDSPLITVSRCPSA